MITIKHFYLQKVCKKKRKSFELFRIFKILESKSQYCLRLFAIYCLFLWVEESKEFNQRN